MKKTIKTLLALMAGTVALTACSEEAFIENTQVATKGEKVQITFSAQQENAGTRAVIDGTVSTQIDWSTGDEFSVFDGTDNCNFTLVEGEGTATATIRGSAAAATTYTALYPYQSGAALSGGDITGVTLPATQTATPGSFDPAAALMMAVTADEEKNFEFKNCVAYIKVTTEVPAKRIIFSSYTCEEIAGTVTLSYNSGAPTAAITANGTDEVTLVPQTGEETIPVGTYYIAVLPQSLQFGFILSYVDEEDITHNRITNNSFTSTRNKVTNMGNINASNTYTNRQIVYYASSQINDYNLHQNGGSVKFKNGNTRSNTSTKSHTFKNGAGVLTYTYYDDGDIDVILNIFKDQSTITKVILPQSLTQFYNECFKGTKITEIYVQKNVHTLYYRPLAGLSNLQKVVLNKNTPVEEGMFNNDPNLTEIYGPYATPDHSAIVKDNVLMSAAGGLTSFTFPAGITKIGWRAFYKAKLAGDIVIPKTVTSIAQEAFYQASSLGTVTFEEGSTLTEIQDGCFFDDATLNIVLPASLQTIGTFAFCRYNANTNTATDIVIPDNVTTIGGSAFKNAKDIENIWLGSSVTSIAEDAFRNITKNSVTELKNIYSKNPTPPTLGTNTFDSTPFEKIYVPTASVDAYKAADVWSGYADKIEGYEF